MFEPEVQIVKSYKDVGFVYVGHIYEGNVLFLLSQILLQISLEGQNVENNQFQHNTLIFDINPMKTCEVRIDKKYH